MGTPEMANLTFDKFGGWQETIDGLEELKISPAKKALVMDTGDIRDSTIEGWTEADKQEGVVLLNPCVVALGNDNDFGLEGQGASRLSIVQLEKCVDDVYADSLAV